MGGRTSLLASLATTWKMRLRLVLKLVLMLICYWWLGSERKKNCNYLEDAIEVGFDADWWLVMFLDLLGKKNCYYLQLLRRCWWVWLRCWFWSLYWCWWQEWLSFVGKKYCNYLEDVDEVDCDVDNFCWCCCCTSRRIAATWKMLMRCKSAIVAIGFILDPQSAEKVLWILVAQCMVAKSFLDLCNCWWSVRVDAEKTTLQFPPEGLHLAKYDVDMSHLLLLGKFDYTGGPIFKVVLEC